MARSLLPGNIAVTCRFAGRALPTLERLTRLLRRGGDLGSAGAEPEVASLACALRELFLAAAISPRRSVGRPPRVGLTLASGLGCPLNDLAGGCSGLDLLTPRDLASSLCARKSTFSPPLRLAAFMSIENS